MRVIRLGNAGAGKSTLSGMMIAKRSAARLFLDEEAFHGSTKSRPLQDSIEDAKRWIAVHASWIIEGC
jgi:adenylate kinase family enzyme